MIALGYVMKTKLANPNNYGVKRLTGVKYIILHSTANDGDTADRNAEYFHNTVVKASAHYFVDDDTIIQSVPDSYIAWSVGGSKYTDCSKTGGGKLHKVATNDNSISIELCDTVKDGTVMATDETLANAADLVKKLMAKYDVDIDHVIRHFDVNGKHCPAYFMDDSKWMTFKRRLLVDSEDDTYEDTVNEGPSEYPDVPFSVRVHISDLNYRSEPSMKGEVKGQTEKGVFTIVDVVGNWGKLKSGVGWIWLGNPNYCTIIKQERG